MEMVCSTESIIGEQSCNLNCRPSCEIAEAWAVCITWVFVFLLDLMSPQVFEAQRVEQLHMALRWLDFPLMNETG